MAEYEYIVTCTQTYRVCVEADDDDTADKLAAKAFWDSDREPLRDDVEFTVDNVYE